MCCRYISSYILLVIIVLSIPRSSIIVNSATAKKTVINPSPKKPRLTPEDAFNMPLFEIRHNHILGNLAPAIKTGNLEPTTEDVFTTQLFNILIDVESVRTSKEAVKMMTRLSPILIQFYEALNSVQYYDNLMRIKSTQSLQLFAAINNLCQKVDNPEDEESVKKELLSVAHQCKNFVCPSNINFTTQLFNILIDVESVRTSKEAVKMMTRLSPILIQFYEALNSVQYYDYLMKILATQTLQLFTALNKLCQKVDNPEDMASVMAELCSVANKCKKSRFCNWFSLDVLKEYHIFQFLALMKRLVFISNREYAVTVMTELANLSLWSYSTPEQLNILFDMIEYLAPECNDSEVVIEPIILQFVKNMKSLQEAHCSRMLKIMPPLIKQIKKSKYATSVIQTFFNAITFFRVLDSNHATRILAITGTLITKVIGSEHTTSVIKDLTKFIILYCFPAFNYVEDRVLLITHFHHHQVLLILQRLIEHVEESEAGRVKHDFNQMDYNYSRIKHPKNAQYKLFCEIQDKFVKKFPDVKA